MAEFGRRQPASFGKRNGGARPTVSAASASVAPDMAAATEAFAKGALPKWTNVGPTRLVLFLIAIVAGAIFMGLGAGDVIRDYRLAGTWQTAYDMKVLDGSCTRHQMLITDCSAHIASVAEPNQAPIKVSFTMGFVGGGGEPLVPVRSTRDPSVVTILYAAETELGNRTLTLLAMESLFVIAFAGVLRSLLRGRYRGGAAHQALLAGLATLQARMASAPTEQRLAA